MTEKENLKESITKKYCRHWMCGGRSNRIFCGILMIVVGLFWLGKKANWFPPELITMFWPAVLVVIGIWIIGGALIKKGA